jgi:4-amino-4-deoxy-L-arabinose transferase-like glycosyltransferase
MVCTSVMPTLPRSRWIAGALLVCALVWFVGLEYRGLFMPDEGRYADISRAMLDTGDWVTPRLNGIKYFEKPPLQYWATAGVFALLGIDEWTARMWPALTGLLCIAFTAFAARRLAPGPSWLFAALAFAGSWGFFIGGQFLTLDMGLTFFLCVAMLAFVLSRRGGSPPGVERNWMLLAWAALACAVLSKGLVAVVIPGLALAVYCAVERDFSPLRRLHWLPGLALFAAIALPWFLLVQEKNPEFFRFFFIYEHFERYLLPDHHRPGPWWYFVPVILVGLLPWTPAIPSAIARAWKAPADGFKVDRFLVIWAAVVVVFFSASHSKLPGYVLPAVPAILLLFARHYPALSARLQRAPALACVAAGGVLALTAVALPALSASLSINAYEPGYSIWLLGAALALLAAGWISLALRKRALNEASFAAAAIGSLIAIQLAVSGTHVLDEHYSSERLIETIVGNDLRFPRRPPFYSVASYDQSIPFYLGRPVTLVGYKDELAPGIAAEPDKYVRSLDEFLALWHDERGEAFAIMKPPLYEKLSGEGLPGHILARDARWIIVARR